MQFGIQLHSVRHLDVSLPELVYRVSDAGYDGVEFAHGIHSADPNAVAEALDATGLVALSGHVTLEALESETELLLDRYGTVGCRRLTVPHLPSRHFRTVSRIRTLARRFEDVADRLAARGFDLVYHNSRHDLTPPLNGLGLTGTLDRGLVPGAIEGALFERLRRWTPATGLDATALALLVECTDRSTVGLQIDTGEVVAAGHNARPVLDAFSDRLSMVHLCDVTRRSDGSRPTRLGTGIVDTTTAVSAARRHGAEWLVYEHDDPVDPEKTIDRGAAMLNGVASD